MNQPLSMAARRVLLSRLLTHSGDQAWDFAVPLALIAAFPGNLPVVALYYLVVKILTVILLPRLGAWLDRAPRARVVAGGIGVQTLGVAGSLVALSVMFAQGASSPGASVAGGLAFVLLIISGCAATLGDQMMAIAIAHDWVPELFVGDERARVNARMKQIDLATELGIPVLTGLVLAAAPSPLVGIAIVASWNIVSFVPEYVLLRGLLGSESKLGSKTLGAASKVRGLLVSLRDGWSDYWREPAAFSMFAYSCLWVTVLSPHGAILTAWLRDGWSLQESLLGVFRGLGAVFGLLATLVFPWLRSRLGVVGSARGLILWQALTVGLAAVAFGLGEGFVLAFLGLILLSRVGLYGFSLGEMEIRQAMVPAERRGRVSSTAGSLNNVATLVVYGAAAILPGTAGFPSLVWMSAAAVGVGALVFTIWSWSDRAQMPRA